MKLLLIILMSALSGFGLRLSTWSAEPKQDPYFSINGIWPCATNLIELIDKNRDLAIQAMEEFRNLIDDEDYKDIGFESLDEVRSATLEAPLVIYWIGLEDLRSYQTNKSPATVLRPAWKVIYPLASKAQVRASVTLQQRSGNWVPSDFGFGDFSVALAAARDKIMKENQLPSTNLFGVEIPGLNLLFIAHEREKKMMFTPISDVPGLNLPAEKSMPAEQVLHLLVPVAKLHNGNPG